jgi:hypothetical protein
LADSALHALKQQGDIYEIGSPLFGGADHFRYLKTHPPKPLVPF